MERRKENLTIKSKKLERREEGKGEKREEELQRVFVLLVFFCLFVCFCLFVFFCLFVCFCCFLYF